MQYWPLRSSSSDHSLNMGHAANLLARIGLNRSKFLAADLLQVIGNAFQLVAYFTIIPVLLGLALGSVQPMVMSTLHQITPKHRHGEALGLRSMAINGSSVLMPLLFGSAGVLVGVGGGFWVVGGVVGAGSRLAWRMRRTLAAHTPEPQRFDG